MIKHFIMASSVVVAAITMITILMFNKVPPVSAQSILDRASQVQTQTAPAKGIEHISYETFFNLEGLPEDQVAGTIQDFYFDYETCNNKRVMINSKTGVVLDVFANDGTYTYGGFNYDINASGPLTVYRSPKDPAGDRCEKPYAGGDRKDLFDQMRSDPNVQIVGQETWAGGHKVYVLRSQTQIRLLGKNNQYKSAPGQLINYFDADTYQFYGGKEVIRGQDGKDLMIDEKLFSVDEFLPDGSRINWDLSDVKGIQMIDDPDGTHRDSGARG